MTRSFETRNVIAWLSDNPSLYRHLCKYAKTADNPTYVQLIDSLGYSDSRTPDGVDWISHLLDYKDLNDFVVEIGLA